MKSKRGNLHSEFLYNCNLLNSKRSQVTIFTILAILIIAVITLLFIFRGKINLENIDSEIKPIHNYVQECIRKTGENALQRIGKQGGYFFIFDEPNLIPSKIPYYTYNKQNYVPEMNKIEQELSFFINEELSFCILNFKDFRNEFEIEHELKSIVVDVRNEGVIFNLDYLIYLTKGERSFELKEFEVSIPVRLGIIYQSILEIISEQQTHLESICLSCLHDLEKRNNFDIEMFDYGEDTTIFTITDNNSKINNESYGFNFAIQYGE